MLVGRTNQVCFKNVYATLGIHECNLGLRKQEF